MTIISIEGASAGGKTTTSAALTNQIGAFHIPEVASWWKKPKQEYPEWFFERQIDRWKIASEKEQDGLVIIDIDLYQPFWYNWAFDFKLFNGQTLEFVENFYRPLLSQRKLGFPDKYFLLYTSESTLRERKRKDETRLRRGFELNLKFIEPQMRYFQALNEFCPGLVCFIESVEVESNVNKIKSELVNCKHNHRYSLDLFDFMVNWTKTNKAFFDSKLEESPTIL
ncbi:ATP-binding protein [Paenibacillus endoradicis]|uniref:ATP-binding protein n=1 Tax=Paenibacillus endoradicis TaxID=2972487 RepID=UPI002159A168|nr:ATP-binding protein [Paenibacillus endoradicis]MCR8656695.1 ATP-binding protein [Paenibacillus endoradicis]